MASSSLIETKDFSTFGKSKAPKGVDVTCILAVIADHALKYSSTSLSSRSFAFRLKYFYIYMYKISRGVLPYSLEMLMTYVQILICISVIISDLGHLKKKTKSSQSLSGVSEDVGEDELKIKLFLIHVILKSKKIPCGVLTELIFVYQPVNYSNLKDC
ncbi:hypothetical protein BpHYR1_032127 [Brachionus plicatilis]|uniref:Uncharacterized protein n=1 Tax=Brachionus plicatilis TaxID=10195 RepID=A0A3M7QP24_BRAPC|nr:hypothetical protein BpHYR1_032127 [Brachionus plicatilis]